jgi:hypothetical protein
VLRLGGIGKTNYKKYRTEKLGSVYSLVCLRGIFRMIKVMCAKQN